MSETRMTVQKIERYLTHVNKGRVEGIREDLSDGFVVYHRQALQLLDCIKRNDADSVLEIMKATLVDSWGKAAQRWEDERAAAMLREVGGSIHERGLRNAS